MYYLHHYFDPDFNHFRLTPEQRDDGSSELRNLNYVQNVVAGQVLAESIRLDDLPDMPRDPRFIYRERHLPIGPNCLSHPKNDNKIIAAVNGYVFYHKGLISVKKLLNVRNHVGFHTGNIFFVGDLAVHGDIHTGFAVQAANILVKGHVESAKIKSIGDFVCLRGVKGSNTSDIDAESLAAPDEGVVLNVPDTLIEARGNIRLPFCEHAQLRARGNIVIDGSCVHSTLYVGGNLIIRGRLQGGTVYANNLVYVEKQIGSDYTVRTRIMMGYDPFKFLSLQKLESQIRGLGAKLAYFTQMASRNEVMQLEYAPRVAVTQRQLEIAMARRHALWRTLTLDEKGISRCRIVVPGTVQPGCEISMGRAFFKTGYMESNVTFRQSDEEEIVFFPNSAK